MSPPIISSPSNPLAPPTDIFYSPAVSPGPTHYSTIVSPHLLDIDDQFEENENFEEINSNYIDLTCSQKGTYSLLIVY